MEEQVLHGRVVQVPLAQDQLHSKHFGVEPQRLGGLDTEEGRVRDPQGADHSGVSTIISSLVPWARTRTDPAPVT